MYTLYEVSRLVSIPFTKHYGISSVEWVSEFVLGVTNFIVENISKSVFKSTLSDPKNRGFHEFLENQ